MNAYSSPTAITELLTTELVFISGDVPQLDQLIASLGPRYEVHVLDPAGDGLAQIAELLQGRTGIDALHLFGHGREGAFRLGSSMLELASLDGRQHLLGLIGQSMSADGDILVYGCDVGAGAGGQSLLDRLALLTGADLAASSDTTGAAALGGDWDLEVRSGQVDAAPAVDAATAQLYQDVLALSNVTLNFTTIANWAPRGSYAKNSAGIDAIYRVGGSAAYQLKFDGAKTATYGSDFSALPGQTPYNSAALDWSYEGESLVTLSFVGGQAFTPSKIDVRSYWLGGNGMQEPTDLQTFVIKGYNAVGGLIASVTSPSIAANGSATITLTGFTLVSSLRITATTDGGVLHFAALDNLVLDTVAAPDTTQPTVTGVTASNANGTYKVGDVIGIQVNFSEAVNVTNSPQITLETGATDRLVSYSSGTGTSTLTFNYVVQAGDTSADLDYLGTGSLGLNVTGTIKDAAGNTAVLTLPAPGAANSLGANKNLVIDGIFPTVTGVTSSAANGSYKAGDVIGVQVAFSEVVNVTGTPQLTLETGATDRVVNYASGTGTNTLTFNYTVQAGDASADLDYTSTAALALNSGFIRDAALNNATLTLPSPGASGSLGANKNLVIDGAAPTVASVSASTANGSYNAGDVIGVQVTFSEVVNVTGTPQLTLETGATDRVVNYTSGTGTNTLTFNYTVQAGDASADLDYTSTAALALNGGFIRDAALNNATLTLPSPGASGSLGANKALVIDTTPPGITDVSSSAADGTYKAGDTLVIAVYMPEAVNVNGTPQLTLETGATDRVVDLSGYTILRFSNGTGNSTLYFAYTVKAGEESPDLDYASIAAFSLNGGAITDDAGNALDLTLPAPGAAGSLGFNKNFLIDATAPTYGATAVVFSNDTGVSNTDLITKTAPQNISGVLSSNLVAGDTVQVSLDNGSTWIAAAATLGQNTFSLAAQTLTGADTLKVRVVDVAGNSGPVLSKAYVLDTSAPQLTAIKLSSSSLKAGSSTTVTFDFSESITGFEIADLDVQNGEISGLGSANGGKTWTATFTPTADIQDTTNVMQLDTSRVADLAGNPGTGIVGSSNYKIDTLRPTLSGIKFSDAALILGETAMVSFQFSEAVAGFTNADITVANGTLLALSSADGGTTWTGQLSPTANIEDASNVLTVDMAGLSDAFGNAGVGTKDSANYTIDTLRPTLTIQLSDTQLGVGETATVTFAFSEKVTGFDNGDVSVGSGKLSAVSSSDGGKTWTATLTPDPGTNASGQFITVDAAKVTDLAGNAGNVLYNSLAYAIDTESPTVTGVNSSTANGTYKIGDLISIQIAFSEAVTVFGTPQLTLETGAVDRLASYVAGSGTTTLSFIYVVQNGDASADLDYVSALALALNGGTITDDVGNAAALTLPAPAATGSLGASKALVIDGVPPWFSDFDMTNATDTGVSADDEVTASGQAVLRFKAEPGSLITVKGALGATLVAGQHYTLGFNATTGVYTVTMRDAQPGSGTLRDPFGDINTGFLTPGASNAWAGTNTGDGTYLIEASDPIGNRVEVGRFTVDTRAPTGPRPTVTPTSATNGANVVLGGTATLGANETLLVNIDNEYFYTLGDGHLSWNSGTGTWQLNAGALPLTLGQHGVWASVSDLAGNLLTDTTHLELTIVGVSVPK